MPGSSSLPRLVIAGLSGDSGKTLISAGLIRALRARSLRVAPFKKGPDYIDASWLGAAARAVGRNLDTFLMPTEAIGSSLRRAAAWADVAVIEGNRGLFDGLDAEGSHSTAQLARMLDAPVVLVVDATKVTRTAAALVLGCQILDPELHLAGVILNRVATARQEAVIREAIVNATGLTVLGALPRVADVDLPSRHLGLVTVAEHPRAEAMLARAAELIERHVDVPALLGHAKHAASLRGSLAQDAGAGGVSRMVRVGIARDEAFSFYYPENLEALEAAGAELVPFSPLHGDEPPEMDALILGGGFPEVHAARLASNRPMRRALARRVREGLPVWAECGGLMFLARSLNVDDVAHEMVGALPVDIEQTARPQGHGYVVARVDGANAFLAEGAQIRGHEFHYSRLLQAPEGLPSVLAVERGRGIGGGRDGLRVGNVVASYTHVHAGALPAWAPALVAAALGRGTLASVVGES